MVHSSFLGIIHLSLLSPFGRRVLHKSIQGDVGVAYNDQQVAEMFKNDSSTGRPSQGSEWITALGSSSV